MALLIPRKLPPFDDIERLSKLIPEVEPRSVEAALLLLRVSNDLGAVCERYFSEHGLSGGRFTVMMFLTRAKSQGRSEGLSPAEIADQLGVTRATVSGLLNNLEKDGLIGRTSIEKDRRMRRVQLTTKGEDLLAQITPTHFTRIATAFSTVSASERKTLIRVLHKLAKEVVQVENASD